MKKNTRGARILAAAAVLLAGGIVAAGPMTTASAANTTSCRVAAGTYLHSGDRVCVGHQYSLVMQPDGNLVEYGNGRALWSTKTSGHPGASFAMQTDTNAVVYDANGKALWTSHTSRTSGKRSAIALGIDGNLVIIDDGNSAVWSTGAPGSNTMTASTLKTGWYLHAVITRLDMQADGNLATYEYSGGPAVWSAGTSGHPGATATLQTDGNLVVRSTTGAALWNTRTAGTGPGNRLVLDTSGHLTLLKGTTVLWRSN